jgi:hypothetical protein
MILKRLEGIKSTSSWDWIRILKITL